MEEEKVKLSLRLVKERELYKHQHSQVSLELLRHSQVHSIR